MTSSKFSVNWNDFLESLKTAAYSAIVIFLGSLLPMLNGGSFPGKEQITTILAMSLGAFLGSLSKRFFSAPVEK